MGCIRYADYSTLWMYPEGNEVTWLLERKKMMGLDLNEKGIEVLLKARQG